MDNTKRISEYGMISALLAVLMIASQYLPILGMVFLVILPVPVIYITLKYNVLGGLAVSLVAGLVSMPILTPIIAIFYMVLSALIGIVIALGLKKKFEPLLTVFLASVVIVALISSISFMMVQSGGLSLRETFNQVYKESFELTKSIFQEYPSISASEAALMDEKMLQLEALAQLTTAMINLLFPAITLGMGLLYGSLVYTLSGKIFRRLNLGIDIAYPKPFSEFSYPKHFAYGTTGMLIMSYLLSKFGLIDGDLVLSNLHLIMVWTFSVQAIAVIYHFMLRKQKRPLAIFFTVLMTFGLVIFLGQVIMSLLGFMDVFVNFRKRRKQVR